MQMLTRTDYKRHDVRQYPTLTDALDAADVDASGINFHSPRGELIEALSYSKLANEARKVGARLLALGLQPGDRVGLVAETEANFVRAFMGCLYAHLVPCPLPLPVAFGPSSGYAEHLKRILKVADASAVIVADEYSEIISGHIEMADFQFCGPVSALPDREASLPEKAANPDQLAYLQFSSGTTNVPKGIAVSHKAVMANIAGMAHDALELGPNDRGMSWLPFYHDMGLVGCMMVPIATHMSMDYLATRDFIRRPGLWATMMSRAKATLSYSPSFGYELAARRKPKSHDIDLSSWRIAGIGGDMIKPKNLNEFVSVYEEFGFRRTNFLASYGMAEASLGLTFEKLDSGCRTQRLDTRELENGKAVIADQNAEGARSLARCGPVLPGHKLEIRDSEGNVLPEQRVGTVFAHGPSIMIEYFGNPAETKAMLSEDGWLNTGDLGYLIDGDLVLTGRAKDLIIINGRNIWPQDIEWSIEQSVESVKGGRIAAFSGAGASSTGEEVVTVVTECRIKDDQKRDEIRKQIDSKVRATFGIIPEIVLSKPGSLPRTSSGKLSRAKTCEMYLAGLFEA